MNYEQKALISGIIINAFSAILGILFFVLTNSKSLLLDGLISTILVISTIVSLLISKDMQKEASSKYPLGRRTLENIFLFLRAILMILIIFLSIVSGIITIIAYFSNYDVNVVNLDYKLMIIYASLMIGSCLLITLIYSYCNRKIPSGSDMIKIEIKSSIYDGLVTLFAVGSLLLFNHFSPNDALKAIGDSIIVIILSLIYLYAPIKELSKQAKILSDRRRLIGEEQKIIELIKTNFIDFDIFDVYFSYSPIEGVIYVCLFPNKKMSSDEIEKHFESIRQFLYKEYGNPKVILVLSKQKLHLL